jgi:hypothetical protein
MFKKYILGNVLSKRENGRIIAEKITSARGKRFFNFLKIGYSKPKFHNENALNPEMY